VSAGAQPAAAGQRVFVGLPVPADVARELVSVAGAALAGCAVRVYPAEDVHLTLVFLGERERAEVESLARALPAALRGVAPLELAVERCGVFPAGEPHAPVRAFWAGVRSLAPGALAELHATVSSACAPPLETGSWTPHLTLARPSAGARVHATDTFLAARFALRWRADEVLLFESRRERTAGPRYATLARIPLIASAG
jgi:2'-5' RNA ligase